MQQLYIVKSHGIAVYLLLSHELEVRLNKLSIQCHVVSYLQADPPENFNLNVKNCPKLDILPEILPKFFFSIKLPIAFFLKVTILAHFIGKNVKLLATFFTFKWHFSEVQHPYNIRVCTTSWFFALKEKQYQQGNSQIR